MENITYDTAVSRIQQAIENHAKELDLSGLGFVEIPEIISELKQLVSLKCSKNPIQDLYPLSDLASLQMLDCKGHKNKRPSGVVGSKCCDREVLMPSLSL